MQTAVQIVGFAHDDKTDGGKAGITFIFKDCIGEGKMNSTSTSAGGWEASQMRSYLNSEGLNLLPSDLKQNVVSVNKLTNNVGLTESTSSVTPTSDRLWLFSLTELCGTISWSGTAAAYSDVLNAEGSQYKLFRDINVKVDGSNSGILGKKLNGKSCSWWERSPYPDYSGLFKGVMLGGFAGGAPFFAANTYGVCPGFCI